jgi:hypothetical protein
MTFVMSFTLMSRKLILAKDLIFMPLIILLMKTVEREEENDI